MKKERGMMFFITSYIEMNKEWSECNKKMQEQLKKDTYELGIETLLLLRSDLMKYIQQLRVELNRSDYDAMPFMNHKGFEKKSIAYSLYHVVRIEDIVANTLIQKKEDIFFTKDYQRRLKSSIITTGNELKKEQIAEFSSKLDLDELYSYVMEVYETSNQMLKELPFYRLKEKIAEEDKNKLKELGVVSEDENAIWLIDYWCSKNIKGLLQMPFSRHWIMHVEACGRIAIKLKKDKS